MAGLRSYVVRIYRQGFRSLSGVVEDTNTGGKRAFRNIRELSALLRAPIKTIAPPGHTRRNPD